MTHLMDLPEDLPELANQLLVQLPKNKWHPQALEFLNKGLRRNKSIGVACSGGADSTFCLLMSFAAFPELRGKITVLHYNHRLRGNESDGDESFVRYLAENLGLQVLVESPPSKTGKADENTLRDARLNFWEKLEKEQGMSIILQGHQLDDVAETLLWRISRGVSVDGLISPKPISELKTLTLVRPFVGITKEFIRKSLEKYSIPWREDITNRQNNYLRNRMRNLVVPPWKQASDRDLLTGVATTRELLKQDSEALEFHALASLDQCRSENKLRIEILRHFPLATQRRVLIKWLGSHSPSGPRHTDLGAKATQLSGNLSQKNFTSMEIFDDCMVLKNEDFLEIKTRLEPIPIPHISIPCGFSIYLSCGAIIKAEVIESTPTLINRILNKEVNPEKEAFLCLMPEAEKIFCRTRRDGDLFMPLGAPGRKKLSDWMIDRKWTNIQKLQTPVFLNSENEIIWIPGFAPAFSRKIKEADHRVIRLTYNVSSTLL